MDDSIEIIALVLGDTLYEEKYSQYYGWPYYWPGPLLWGPVPYPGLYLPEIPPAQPLLEERERSEDSHLRSTSEVIGYEMEQVPLLRATGG